MFLSGATFWSAQTAPLPEDTEERISDFAELVGTAIAAATARDEHIASRARIVAAADDARRWSPLVDVASLLVSRRARLRPLSALAG